MRALFFLIILGLVGCNEDISTSELKRIALEFEQPQKAHIIGYNDHIMEPFLSRNGQILLFNNSNASSVNTNIHFASRVNDSVFQYIGELKGINTEFLEGTPSLCDSNVLYFVSNRSYDQTLSTIYSGYLNNDSISNIQLVQGISQNRAGWVNFDVEVSKDGNFLYFVDGQFNESGGPYESNLSLAARTNGIFQRTNNSALENINTSALEYAACISSNMLELYFTRVEMPLSESSIPQIYVAIRNSVNEPYSAPRRIEEITGFAEAPTISSDDQIIYYHKKENDKFELYMIRKK